MYLHTQFFTCLLIAGCLLVKNAAGKPLQSFRVKVDSLDLYDQGRQRSVPVALYLPQTDKKISHQKIIIVSHGYNGNQPGSNKRYSYLTGFLASKGYFVASIQHELATDSLLPSTGIPQVVRRSNWERGVQNILFVLNELKKSNPALDYRHLILIGHSNGGDMSMLFAENHPSLVDKVISLDNRRVAFPRTKQPKMYSLRSSDQPADEGVLPTTEEQDKYGMKIIKLANTIHNDMSDNGNEAQHREINHYILGFLDDR